jgi:hypothetical protein
MDKITVLNELKALVLTGQVSQEEVMGMFPGAVAQNTNVQKASVSNASAGVAEVLYYIGGAVVILGIGILVGQNWSQLSAIARVLVTLGSGLVAFIMGTILGSREHTERVSAAFHLIGAALIPFGLYVALDAMSIDAGTLGWQVVIATVMTLMYLLSFFRLRKVLHLLFAILFGTMLYYAVLNYIAADMVGFYNFYQYITIVAGAAYIFLGYSFAKNEDYKALNGFLYSFGTLGVLGAAITLGNTYSPLWDVLYIPLLFGALIGSTFLRSRAMLTFATLFLMGYVIKLTAVYFSSGLGWPLALVIAGLGLIGSGYLSIYLRKKYM